MIIIISIKENASFYDELISIVLLTNARLSAYLAMKSSDLFFFFQIIKKI